MFEIEDLYELMKPGAFSSKEEFLEFAKGESVESLYDLVEDGAFSSKEEFASMIKPMDVMGVSQEVKDEFAKDPVREAVKKKRRYGICIGRWFIGIANIR